MASFCRVAAHEAALLQEQGEHVARVEGLRLCRPGLSPALIPKSSYTQWPAPSVPCMPFHPEPRQRHPRPGSLPRAGCLRGSGRAKGDAQPTVSQVGSVWDVPGQLNPTSQRSTLLSEGRRWLPVSMAAGGSPFACLGPPPQPAPHCQPGYIPILAESGWGPFSPLERSIPVDRR